ncbi:MAG: hypothetical protein QXV17_09690 [Candidatus Micrarchaeaceae archaeon]
MMGLRYEWTKFRHWLKGDARVWTYGVGNIDVEMPALAFLFYDLDSHEVKLRYAVERFYQQLFGDYFAVLMTKHGYLFMSLESITTDKLYEHWKYLQKLAPSDYTFSIPSYIRLGPKISTRDGKVISPAPRLYRSPWEIGKTKEFINLRMSPKVTYYTWD